MSALPNEEQTGPRSPSGSTRSSQGRRQNPQQQLSQIEKSVTHLLVATKQLLETLTHWSRGSATEGEVSDVYVRLGYEFNIACRAFNAIGVDTNDLGPVPDLLRTILEETLSQEASQASLDRFLPRIRDIIINLLHGLKRKQQRLRQRSGREYGSANGVASTRQGSITSTAAGDLGDAPARQSSGRSARSQEIGDPGAGDGPELPPRTTSVNEGRASPTRYGSASRRTNLDRNTTASRDTVNSSSDSSMSSNTMQNIPVMAPYPQEDTMPPQPSKPPPATYSSAADFPHPPPPPPPPKQQDALAQLGQRGELERRASRRFSQYQIHKQLGTGVPMIPSSQQSPIPNRGRDLRESMNAVRSRGSYMGSRQNSANKIVLNTSPNRKPQSTVDRRISEESSLSTAAPEFKPPPEPAPLDSPTIKTPEDKLGISYPGLEELVKPTVSASISGPFDDQPAAEALQGAEKPALPQRSSVVPSRHGSRRTKSPPTPLSQPFIPDQSPQPGKELTLFLQYKSKIKKVVFPDGYNDLSLARLQLAFIEKFAWNTHDNGADLPEIYIQDPVSGVRHELEDLSDIKDRSVLALNVEVLDEVKRHIDDGIDGLRRVVEGIKSTVEDQQSALQRVAEKQQEAANELAGIAAAPPSRLSMLPPPPPTAPSTQTPLPAKDTTAQLAEVQSLRRDLAVVRQTYTAFASDISSTMSTLRSKAAAVKTAAVKATAPPLTGDAGRSYVNAGRTTLTDDSEKIVARVDEVQDAVEDLRKDVVSRGVRPLPRQLEVVAKELQGATAELKKLQEFLRREKPLWTRIWEQELAVVVEDRRMLTEMEELAADLEDDLDKAGQTFSLVEQATKQQNLQGQGQGAGQGAASVRSASGSLRGVAMDREVDPRKAKDGVLGEVRALQPNHEGRLEAIERAERARVKELESRKRGEFQRELGDFVEEGRLKKSGGVEEAERLRKSKDERIRREVWERQNGKASGTENGKPAEVSQSAGMDGALDEASTPTATSTPVPAPLPPPNLEETAKAVAGATTTEAVEVPLPETVEPLDVPPRSDDGESTTPDEFVEAKEEPATPAEDGSDTALSGSDGPQSSWLSNFIGRSAS